MRFSSAINSLLLVALVLITFQTCLAFLVPTAYKIRSQQEQVGGGGNGEEGESIRQLPPDKCVCANKGRICEVICKNNPSEGGKFCNCDTYALRANGPCFTDCNKLI